MGEVGNVPQSALLTYMVATLWWTQWTVEDKGRHSGGRQSLGEEREGGMRFL